MLEALVERGAKIYLIVGTVESRPEAVALDLARSIRDKIFGKEGKVVFLSCLLPPDAIQSLADLLSISPLKVVFSPIYSSEPLSALCTLLFSSRPTVVVSDLFLLSPELLDPLLSRHADVLRSALKEILSCSFDPSSPEGAIPVPTPKREDIPPGQEILLKILHSARQTKNPLILISSEKNAEKLEPLADVYIQTEHKRSGDRPIELNLYVRKTPSLKIRGFRYTLTPGSGVQFEKLFTIS